MINRLGFRDQARLEAFEAEVTAERAAQPAPPGRLSYTHYRAIHQHLFQDVYAGLARQRHLRGLDKATFARRAAHLLAELNAIRPFREGNGRTQLSFLTLLAERAGHPLDMERLAPEAMLAATITSFRGNEKPLADLIRGLV